MIPGGSADELLQDQALDINQRCDVLSILAWQVRQQPLEVEVHVALAGVSRKSLLIGHDEVAKAVHQWVNTSGETMQSLNNSACRCAHTDGIFSPPQNGMSIRNADWKRVDTTRGYVVQQGSKEGHTVGLNELKEKKKLTNSGPLRESADKHRCQLMNYLLDVVIRGA